MDSEIRRSYDSSKWLHEYPPNVVTSTFILYSIFLINDEFIVILILMFNPLKCHENSEVLFRPKS